MISSVSTNVNLTFLYGSDEINHNRKSTSYMINFFHIINSQHGGESRKQGTLSRQRELQKTIAQAMSMEFGKEDKNNSWTVCNCLGGVSGELWSPHARGQPQFCGLPFGFPRLCMLAQSSLFPKGSDVRTLCRVALDLWSVSVGSEQGKKKITFAK